jgi:LmbE family N-acetylglucosaminyl deacetylase
MNNPYLDFVHTFVRAVQEGRNLPLGGISARMLPPLPDNALKVLLFSPHPDDESITGALPLRLRRERGVRIINVAVTLGSKVARREGRWQELQAACKFLGFEVRLSRPGGLENINPKGRDSQPDQWADSVNTVVRIIQSESPAAIVMPHEGDWNSTHIGTHYLVVDALRTLGPTWQGMVIETEFWAAMADPNLMVECSPEDLADLVAAVSFHAGEVQRNPYHLTLPAWMQDNVRRGGELVGGQGGAAPDFIFATLYRLRRWDGTQLRPVLERPQIVPASQPLDFI